VERGGARKGSAGRKSTTARQVIKSSSGLSTDRALKKHEGGVSASFQGGEETELHE